MSGTTRLIALGLLPRFMVAELIEVAEKQLPFRKKGGEIVSLPVDQVIGMKG